MTLVLITRLQHGTNNAKMATGFYDLNVLINDDNLIETVKSVEQLIRFGYQVVAVNKIHTVSAKRKRNGKKVVKEPDAKSTTVDRILSMLKSKPNNFKLLSRITVILDSHEHVRELQSDYVRSFDIVAVRPTNLKLFQQVCNQIELADIISMDLDSSIGFKTGYKAFGAAISRGLFVEVSYASAIRSSSLRQSVLANGMHITKRCRGRGIILSSGAEHFMEVRGPYDIINLGLLFDLTERSSKMAISKNSFDVVLHAFGRSQTAKSVLTMRKVGEPLSTLEMIVRTKDCMAGIAEPVIVKSTTAEQDSKAENTEIS